MGGWLSFSLKTRRVGEFFWGKFPRGIGGFHVGPFRFSLEQFSKLPKTHGTRCHWQWDWKENLKHRRVWDSDHLFQRYLKFGQFWTWVWMVRWFFFLRFFEVHPTIVQHKLREDILLFCHLGCFVIWRYLKGILRKFRDCFRWNAAPWISNRRCNICACGWCIFILGSRNCYTCSIRLYTSKSLLTPYYLSTILHTKQALWPTWEYYCWVLPPPGQNATNCYWNPGWWGGLDPTSTPEIFGDQRKLSAESTVWPTDRTFSRPVVTLFLVAKDIPS